MKIFYIGLLCLTTSIYGQNKFFTNDGIVDVGIINTTSTIEVQKQLITREPDYKQTENKIVYMQRIQSEKFNCKKDFLGNEVCENKTQKCDGVEEYSDSYSVAHHVKKTLTKFCLANEIQVGDKCFLDDNFDGQRDDQCFVNGKYYDYDHHMCRENININGLGLYGSRFLDEKQEQWIEIYNYKEVIGREFVQNTVRGRVYLDENNSFKFSVVGSNNLKYTQYDPSTSGGSDFAILSNLNHKLRTGENISYRNSKGNIVSGINLLEVNQTVHLLVSTNKYERFASFKDIIKNPKKMSFFGSYAIPYITPYHNRLIVQDSRYGSEVFEVSQNSLKRYYSLSAIESESSRAQSPFILEVEYRIHNLYNKPSCPDGYKSEEQFCYANARCPKGSIETEDGECLLEYDWYSYHCEDGTNSYDNKWSIIETGYDCGNPLCTNSATPPKNNCVRKKFICPIDSERVCAKIEISEGSCETGYKWNNDRCERIETYCGNETYNALLDRCEHIESYVKLCKSQNDNYDKSQDICISSTEACYYGSYDEKSGFCVDEVIGYCENTNYKYIKDKDLCIDENEKLCSNSEYEYVDSLKECIKKTNVCDDGFEYDHETNQCLEVVCNILNTFNDGSRCSTESLCDGILTEEGNCIPYKIQK